MSRKIKEKNMEKDIMEKVSLTSVRLLKVEGINLLSDNQPTDNVELNTKWSYNIKSNENKKLILTAEFKLFFTPESIFKTDLSYIITYRCLEQLNIEDIKSNIEILLDPCANLNSLLVGLISEKFGGLPLIVKPEIELSI